MHDRARSTLIQESTTMPHQAPKAMTLDDLDGRLFASIPEAARVLGWSEHTVRRGVEDGSIPYAMAGSHKRVKVTWLRQVAGEPEPAPPAEPAVSQEELRRAVAMLKTGIQQQSDTVDYMARLLGTP
jgi:excisionase family DNA binding protein